MVVVKEPHVIRNYQDFLNDAKMEGRKETFVIFYKLLQEYETFQNAPLDSLEHQVYNYRLLLDMNVTAGIHYIDHLLKQRAIMAGREAWVETVSLTLLKLLEVRQLLDSRTLRVQEEDPKKYTNVMA